MDGVINLDKPAGITSAKAVYRVRSLIGQRKCGHTGTLDPAATGVLVVAIGQATRLTELVMNCAKTYRATLRLDVTSASLDADSELQSVPVEIVPDAEHLERALDSLRGCIQQVPPAVSAIKVAGRRAYELQRKGQTPALAPRPAMVYRLVALRYEWPEVDLEMTCGRGTYVRAIARDLGAFLHTGGCVTRLSRLAVGPFQLADAVTLDDLAAADDPARYIVPLDEARRLIQADRPADAGDGTSYPGSTARDCG